MSDPLSDGIQRKVTASILSMSAVQWTGTNARPIEEFTSGQCCPMGVSFEFNGRLVYKGDWLVRIEFHGHYSIIVVPEHKFRDIFSDAKQEEPR